MMDLWYRGFWAGFGVGLQAGGLLATAFWAFVILREQEKRKREKDK